MFEQALFRGGAGAGAGAGAETGAGMSKEEEYEFSRSGSDNVEGGSCDDADADADAEVDNSHRKKRYHRHTPEQIQELEALFKEYPHPDEKQRLQLSKRLNLETRQVKFWFQNRRTQMKTQLERHENSILRQENEKLRVENVSIRDGIRNPMCAICGGPAVLGEMSMEEQQLRIENARLKHELEQVCALAGKCFGRLIPSDAMMPKSCLDLGATRKPMPGVTEELLQMQMEGLVPPPAPVPAPSPIVVNRLRERTMLAELALASMDELVKMAQTDEPLWIPSLDAASMKILDYQQYMRHFPCAITSKPLGLAGEATKETAMVIINSSNLVETLMDVNRWKEMFSCIVSKAATVEIISSGMGGTRNGALQLICAQLRVLSPLVPARKVYFLRFCKQHAEGVWAVADVSVEKENENESPMYRRLPSGCVVEDMMNGYSRVTWVEHTEYDDREVHSLFRGLLNSGAAFGARRWVETLRRHCEFSAVLATMNMDPPGAATAMAVPTPNGRRSMLKLAHRMLENFCTGVSASTEERWHKVSEWSNMEMEEDVRVMTRKTVDRPGEPPGVVLTAATSVWLPFSSHKLFDFLRDERLRSQWDILSNGGPMQEMSHIPKGHDPANCVSLLRASAMNANQSGMLILQETCTDASGSLVVYAPVDIPAMHAVMSGGDSDYVVLLPSGFAILPNGPQSKCRRSMNEVGGSLLTVAFQILVNDLPTAKLTVESVETVNHLISCTIHKIKAALHCEDP